MRDVPTCDPRRCDWIARKDTPLPSERAPTLLPAGPPLCWEQRRCPAGAGQRSSIQRDLHQPPVVVWMKSALTPAALHTVSRLERLATARLRPHRTGRWRCRRTSTRAGSTSSRTPDTGTRTDPPIPPGQGSTHDGTRMRPALRIHGQTSARLEATTTGEVRDPRCRPWFPRVDCGTSTWCGILRTRVRRVPLFRRTRARDGLPRPQRAAPARPTPHRGGRRHLTTPRNWNRLRPHQLDVAASSSSFPAGCLRAEVSRFLAPIGIGHRVLTDVCGRPLVLLSDPLVEHRHLDAPRATTPDLDRRQVARAHERIDLRLG